jgi:arylsulfatase A-like enzyme
MPRILYLDIDCLRWDRLSCNGNPRPTSPTIDALAARGVNFTNCHCSDAPCLPSRAALFSGRFGVNNGAVCHEGPAQNLRYPGDGHWHDPSREHWVRTLQRSGWTTVSFSGFAQRHRAWWYLAGFTDSYSNRLPGGSESAEFIESHMAPWLEANGRKDRWFLHVNFWDTHTPYNRQPEPYNRMMAEIPGQSWPTDEQIREDYARYFGPRTPRDWHIVWRRWGHRADPRWPGIPESIPGRAEFDRYLVGYDAALRYVDDSVARLLAILEKQGVLDDTLIMVSSDHGEAIGEQGMYFEHGNCSEGVNRIPLVLAGPGVKPGLTSDALVYQFDVIPALLAAAGCRTPPRLDCGDLSPALGGQPFAGRDHLVLGCGIYSFQRAVRTRSHRLIRTIHPGYYPYEDKVLVDLAADPLGRTNALASQPEVAARLDSLYSDWWHRHCAGPGASIDPFTLMGDYGPYTYGEPEDIIAEFERQGRGEQAAVLRRRLLAGPRLRGESRESARIDELLKGR